MSARDTNLGESFPAPGCGCALCSGRADFGRPVALTGGRSEWAAAPGVPSSAGTPYYVAALLPVGAPKWGAAMAGSAASVTFSFMETAPSYADAQARAGFAPMSAAQRTAVRQAFAVWAEVANITFTEIADSSGGGSIRLGTNRQNGTSVGYAYYPSPSYTAAGDVYIANDAASNANPVPGSYGFKTLLHEIGHSIGLKHPGNYNAGGGGTEGPYLPSAEDNYQYSIMAYGSHPTLGYAGLAKVPALYDVAAIQHLYGANGRTRAGDDTYSFADTTSAFSHTVWDGGGNDTIDARQQSLGVTIDLRAGAFSSIGTNGAGGSAANNVSIAYGVTLENALGGTGSDVLIGNDAANRLSGGEGDDRMFGGAGDDVLDGGGGADTAVFSGQSADYDTVRLDGLLTVSHRGGDGTDRLTGIEYIEFVDRRVGLRPPVVAPVTVAVAVGSVTSAPSLFTAADPGGSPMTAYELIDGTIGGGYLTFGGLRQPEGASVSASAATLPDARFVAGPGAGTDRISVRAYNGLLWSDWVSWDLATQPLNRAPALQASKTLSVQNDVPVMPLGISVPLDPDGDAMTVTLLGLPHGGTVRLADGRPLGGGVPLSPADLGGLTFTPAAGFSGPAGALVYSVSDGRGGMSQQSVALQLVSLASQLAGFDPLVYLTANPDLMAAFGANAAAARQHFISTGRFEGRSTGSFDALSYLALNADVAGVLVLDRTAALTHYIQYGYREGRPITGFSARAYLAANPDLAAAFGENETAAVNHYLQHGRSEGRAVSFDAFGYLAANLDLAAAFGTDTTAALNHYLQHGRSEGRAVSFDARSYLAVNPDVATAVGFSAAAATLHYVQHGRAEGRSVAPYRSAAASAAMDQPLFAAMSAGLHGLGEKRSSDFSGLLAGAV